MIGFFAKLTFGHYRKHLLEALLCLAGVALGVAVVIAIDSAIAACVTSFTGAVDSMAERSTHSIFNDAGTLTDADYIALLMKKLSYPLAPVIDRGILIYRGADADHALVGRMIGVDVFSEQSFRSFTHLEKSIDATAFRKFLTEPNTVVLVDALADDLHAKVGDQLPIAVGPKRSTVTVVAIIPLQGVARSQLGNLMIADIATAQELSDSIGELDRIDTKLNSQAAVDDLTAQLPKGLVLRSTRQQAASLTELTQSYQLNLAALSLMASFVAVFIVYNSMLISVQQRVKSLGILRCLGASRWQLGGIYVVEAGLFAAIGAGLGILGGWGLARILVGYVSTTINDLYASVAPGPVSLSATAVAKGCAVSAASCVVGAIIPLWQASRAAPINTFGQTAQHRDAVAASRWLLIVGVLLGAIAGGLNFIPGGGPLIGFVMAALAALAFALICPATTRLCCAVLAAMAKPFQQLPLQMAASGVARSLGITGVAIAATMLALAMNVGVRTMVSSFRGELDNWLGRRFSADIFVAPELLVNHKIDATLDPAVQDWVRHQPQVKRIVNYRGRDWDICGKPALLAATDVDDTLRTLPLKQGPTGPTFDPAHDLLVSEPLAGRCRVQAGDALPIDTPSGPRKFNIYAVFYDFGTERGQVILDLHTYADLWHDNRLTSLHVDLNPGVNIEETAAAWEAALQQNYPVAVSSFADIKHEAMRVFDRTFKVTEVLTWLAGAVAFCGLAGSLLALALARQQDYSLLAAIGMSGRQMALWVLAQGLLLAWTAAIVAAAAGTVLAYVLAYVIQYRSFGWSIPTHPQPRFWIDDLLLATAAAIVAAIYPARRLRKTPPAGSLRHE